MPQFDFTTYSSQIFWFLVCFAFLYAAVAAIILPRVRSIIEERKGVIDADLSSAEDLENKIYDMHNKTDSMKKEANFQYQIKLEETTKEALKQREKLVEELKEKIENMTKKSRQELKAFVEQSGQKSEAAVQDLVKTIKTKLF